MNVKPILKKPITSIKGSLPSVREELPAKKNGFRISNKDGKPVISPFVWFEG